MRKAICLLVACLISTAAFVSAYNGHVASRELPASGNPPVKDHSIPDPNKPSLTSVTFPSGAFLIPFDDHQNDIIKAFGYVHALLRNNTVINRIIQPIPDYAGGPNTTMKTQDNPGGAEYSGGPILVMESYSAKVNAVKSAFPTVTLDRLTEDITSSYVHIVQNATKICLFRGKYGLTEELLTDMEIPFTAILHWAQPANISFIHNYTLVIDDCPGWQLPPPWYIPGAYGEFNKFVNDGKELIFTDIAGGDFTQCEWGSKMDMIDDPFSANVFDCNFYSIPDFPGQYSGPSPVKIYQMSAGKWGLNPDSDVQVMADYWYNGTRYIMACYFYWGPNHGVVEFFGYHPPEQTLAKTGDPESYKVASFLYGNKFLHTAAFDSGMIPSRAVSPMTIKKEGTGVVPAEEQATVHLANMAKGAPYTMANEMVMNYETMPYINYVQGSFIDPKTGTPRVPDRITDYPNGSHRLSWDIPGLIDGQSWNVTFKITSTQVGKVYTHTMLYSNVSYIDFQGVRRSIAITPVKITVVQGSGGVIEPFYALVALAIAGTAVLAIFINRKSRK